MQPEVPQSAFDDDWFAQGFENPQQQLQAGSFLQAVTGSHPEPSTSHAQPPLPPQQAGLPNELNELSGVGKISSEPPTVPRLTACDRADCVASQDLLEFNMGDLSTLPMSFLEQPLDSSSAAAAAAKPTVSAQDNEVDSDDGGQGDPRLLESSMYMLNDSEPGQPCQP